ncbi:bifunctional UDP-N-acetylglucosamine diphosphorylase/glucosamine-1-phosphate N-acetyltransferase GlmU [Pseudonocardia sp. RS11V-5]|uniref:bifunctional UDP-N-acetylglucosamine diphosphorylase/glucosamine-1-phosphate N-acetyltransferase GlmU n=1 Tax=Pseudonocardia terrae TaxID=2905831 RepID=UPI001E4801D4|nr:bifunctional UDP-N-acetylglucosamine diphosphorylase/glucosamine-1-phosphate N-acetyltransferase GlmU [Pseudonocardia terrae]MCE3551271.1 bifunctional UDP-N-acetylglucosamine diphosphorylase/glucosamine-1-phosphate N-acetyltransferase GlmU [Pseudonocardia terrae]
MPDRPSARPAAAVVLAAGEGTRMRSATPKVLHEIGGRSLLGHAVHAVAELEPEHLAVVVGHAREQVGEALERLGDEVARRVLPAVQEQQNGTGDAVRCGLAALPGGLTGTVLVTYGDVPLLDATTFGEVLRLHETAGAAVTLLTTDLDDPTGYGRIVRDPTGSVLRIVEQKDATEEQRALTEINSGVYAFDAAFLAAGLGRLDTANAQGELYLTDLVALAVADGLRVEAVRVDDPWLVAGVNDRVQLAAVRAELNRRVLERWMLAGVTVVDPTSTWVDVQVRLGRDVVVEPGTQLRGQTTVGDAAVVGPDSTLTDVEIGEGASVVRTHGSSSWIGPGASVGPFAYLRPGARLGADGKIGTFVEVKNAEIGRGSKVPHLTYVGDATIGEQSNIGASSVFVNYDGVAKHRTTIGSHVRTGSDTMFIAPVNIGDGAYTGAGTVVREDVPPGALAVSSGPQRTIDGWVVRKRPGTPAAEAAERASDTAARDAAESGRGGTAQ